MPIIASDPGGNFTPAPEGTWPAVCCDVVDLGIVETQWGNKHKVRIVWQLDPDAGLTNDSKPLVASARFNLSLHEHSTLRPFLESWRGRKFTAAELQGFDLEKLIGANCQLLILHEDNNGKTYANVKTIMPYPKGVDKLQVFEYVRSKDREAAPLEDGEPEETEF